MEKLKEHLVGTSSISMLNNFKSNETRKAFGFGYEMALICDKSRYDLL